MTGSTKIKFFSVYNHGKVEKIYAKRIGEDRSGTGDVISAVIAGSYLKEQNFLEAVKKSTDFASKCIQHSVDIDAHPHMGLCFEPFDLIFHTCA